jgi:FkbM family methyltransferase
MNKISKKIKSNLKIYKNDLKTKGLFYSVVHRLYKIPGVKSALLPTVNYLKPDYITIMNQKLYIDKFDTTVSEKMVVYKNWEDFETKVFMKTLHPGDVVIDIGAHIGYYTLIAAKIVGNAGKVFAFEPNERNFKLLQKNVKENGYKNVVLINKAVTKKSGSIKLYINNQNTGDHRIYDSQDNRKAVTVQTISLNDFFKNKNNLPFMKKVSLIKMDIQGSEVEALKGGLDLLKNNSQIKLITEFWPFGMNLNKTSAKEFLNLLETYKFKFYEINEKNNTLKLTQSQDVLKKYPETSDDYTNLLCTKEEISV